MSCSKTTWTLHHIREVISFPRGAEAWPLRSRPVSPHAGRWWTASAIHQRQTVRYVRSVTGLQQAAAEFAAATGSTCSPCKPRSAVGQAPVTHTRSRRTFLASAWQRSSCDSFTFGPDKVMRLASPMNPRSFGASRIQHLELDCSVALFLLVFAVADIAVDVSELAFPACWWVELWPFEAVLALQGPVRKSSDRHCWRAATEPYIWWCGCSSGWPWVVRITFRLPAFYADSQAS